MATYIRPTPLQTYTPAKSYQPVPGRCIWGVLGGGQLREMFQTQDHWCEYHKEHADDMKAIAEPVRGWLYVCAAVRGWLYACVLMRLCASVCEAQPFNAGAGLARTTARRPRHAGARPG